MGVIQKQAIRNTAIQLGGNVFGAVTRLLMPIALSEAQIGLIQTLEYVSGSFKTIFNLGFNQVLTRMFPDFRNPEKGHHGFFALGLYISLIGFVFALLLYFVLGTEFFVSDTDAHAGLVKAFLWLAIPRMFFELIFYNLDGYARMLFNSVIGAFLESLVLKIIFALGIVLFYYQLVNFEGMLYVVTIGFMLPGIIILIYSFKQSNKIVAPDPSIYKGGNGKRMLEYMLFGILAGATGSFVLYIDSFMVSTLISLEALGIYATLFFAARLIIVPSRSINRIANTILAESWKEKDLDNILVVYRKSCINQLIIGGFLFILGWNLIEGTMSFSDKFESYQQHLYVFFFLGLSTLTEMATGINAGVIATSERYKMNTYLNIGLVVLLVVTNYVFIDSLGLEGAALASLVATFVINFIRWFYLVKVYHLQPFDRKFLMTVIFVAIFIGLSHFMKFSFHPVFSLVLQGFLLTLFYWVGVVGFRFSEDINSWLLKMKKKIKS